MQAVRSAKVPSGVPVGSQGCDINLLPNDHAAAPRLFEVSSSQDSSAYAFHVLLFLAVPAAPAGGSPERTDFEVLHGVSIGSLNVQLHVLPGDFIPQRSVPAIRRWSWLRGMPQAFGLNRGWEGVPASAVVRTQPLVPLLMPAAQGGASDPTVWRCNAREGTWSL